MCSPGSGKGAARAPAPPDSVASSWDMSVPGQEVTQPGAWWQQSSPHSGDVVTVVISFHSSIWPASSVPGRNCVNFLGVLFNKPSGQNGLIWFGGWGGVHFVFVFVFVFVLRTGCVPSSIPWPALSLPAALPAHPCLHRVLPAWPSHLPSVPAGQGPPYTESRLLICLWRSRCSSWHKARVIVPGTGG